MYAFFHTDTFSVYFHTCMADIISNFFIVSPSWNLTLIKILIKIKLGVKPQLLLQFPLSPTSTIFFSSWSKTRKYFQSRCKWSFLLLHLYWDKRVLAKRKRDMIGSTIRETDTSSINLFLCPLMRKMIHASIYTSATLVEATWSLEILQHYNATILMWTCLESVMSD